MSRGEQIGVRKERRPARWVREEAERWRGVSSRALRWDYYPDVIPAMNWLKTLAIKYVKIQSFLQRAKMM